MEKSELPEDSSDTEGTEDQRQIEPILKEDIVPPEILESLPAEIRNVLIKAGSFSGPLPPPEMIIAYEKTLAGSTDRIITLTEKQQDHRHQWENKELDNGIMMAKRGQLFGFILGLCGLGVTVFLAYAGFLVIPGIVGIASTIGLFATAFQSFFEKSRDKDTRS